MNDVFNKKTMLHPLPKNIGYSHCLSIIELNGDAVDPVIKDKFLRGQFFSFVPVNTPREKILNLSNGGVFPAQPPLLAGRGLMTPVEGQEKKLSEFIIKTFSDFSDQHLFIREPYLDRNEIKYNFLEIGKSFFKNISIDGVSVPTLANEIGCLSVCWSFLSIFSEKSYFYKDFSDFLKNSVCISVNAYDGESYCIWLDESVHPAR